MNGLNRQPSHLNRLHFDELVQPLLAPFSPVTRLFVATERRVIIERRTIEETLAGAQLTPQLQGALRAAGPDTAGQAER